MSFLEAMAMGKAVVAADNPTMNEYLTHNVNGYLFNPEDPRPIILDALSGHGQDGTPDDRARIPPLGAKQRANCHMASLGPLAEAASLGAQRKDDSPKISVISLLSNDCTTLKRCVLTSPRKPTPNLEHIIAGNSQPRA